MIAAVRRSASPYARRLAREQGLALAQINGSGPRGRIVAADIEVHALAASAMATLPVPVLAPAVSAFGITIDLQKLHALLVEFGGAGIGLTLDDMVLRAAAGALRDSFEGRHADCVAWEVGNGTDRGEIVLEGAATGLLSSLHARLADALAGVPVQSQSRAAALSVRLIAQSAIRPIAMPLLPQRVMRLVISATDTSPSAEGLLCYDARAIDENEAAAFLARVRDDIQTPLRLLA